MIQIYLHKILDRLQGDIAKQLRLTIELVPNPLWGVNLHKILRRSVWNKLREQVKTQYNNRCGICQVENVTLICHEIWQYDDIAHIQKLNGLIVLCEKCNLCKHLGRTKKLAEEGKVDLSKVIEHFMRVNRCSYEEYQAYDNEAFKTWRERNKHEWTTDFGEYTHFLPQASSDN